MNDRMTDINFKKVTATNIFYKLMKFYLSYRDAYNKKYARLAKSIL